ncbi:MULTISPECIES: hypothetical protein [unclassified Nocardioides]|uniref:hypothetical protein n=1 Tax=unclassified Nocardioides TaxID=2615069 RepID=UPI0006F404A0|nr:MULTISPECIES: hypothetical protein [unclassified Nocardioides]KRA37578.1 hypothetical protein ASD81_02400 [Nocardioides sp. Root614]KRA91539.1 hypothetical protein ASD84_02665 [Nocardioides sp. Root682]
MSKYRMRAAALLAAGAVAGGVTAATLTATADGTTSGDSSASAAARPGPGGPGGHGRGGAHVDTAALAKALGVTEDKLTAAFEAVREDLEPAEKPAEGEKPTPPTDEERADRQAALAKALADELGLDESKVADALDTVRAAEKAERRTDLSDRLDTAVKDGDLTSADKASVLKAYDAGVLGGH